MLLPQSAPDADRSFAGPTAFSRASIGIQSNISGRRLPKEVSNITWEPPLFRIGMRPATWRKARTSNACRRCVGATNCLGALGYTSSPTGSHSLELQGCTTATCKVSPRHSISRKRSTCPNCTCCMRLNCATLPKYRRLVSSA